MPSKNLIMIQDILIQGAAGQAGAAAAHGIFYVGLRKLPPREYLVPHLAQQFKNQVVIFFDDRANLYILDSNILSWQHISPTNKNYPLLIDIIKKIDPNQNPIYTASQTFDIAKELSNRKNLILRCKSNHQKIYIKDHGNTDTLRVSKILGLLENISQEALKNHEPGQITRAITDEFSFYPKETPYSINEYKEIINGLNEICSTLPPDIHLILTSFPVLWPDGGTHQCGLHAQSPTSNIQTPIIHHFSKKNFSTLDFVYINAQGIPFDYTSDNFYNPEYNANAVLTDTAVALNDINQYDSALKLTTSDGKSFITTIGICLDHSLGVERRQVHGLIEQLQNAAQDIPFHCSHVITSNTISSSPHHTLSTLSHADPDRLVRSPIGQVERKILSESRIFNPFNTFSLRAEVYVTRPMGTLFGDLVQHIAANQTLEAMENKINQGDEEGNTLLHLIFEETRYDVELIGKRLLALISCGGDPTLSNKMGKTIIDLASIRDFSFFLDNTIKNAVILRNNILLENSIDPSDGQTNLTRILNNINDMGEISNEVQNAIKQCILNGANPYKRNTHYKSAMDIINENFLYNYNMLINLITDTGIEMQDTFVRGNSISPSPGTSSAVKTRNDTQENTVSPFQAIKNKLEEIKPLTQPLPIIVSKPTKQTHPTKKS